MKVLVRDARQLRAAGRWDIDFHLPAELIREYPDRIVGPIRDVACVVRSKRDPTREPEKPFKYIDISSVDVVTGSVGSPQDLIGEEAPSRARKVVHAYDIIISTCRPTRGAIAVVPEDLHGQICSTGFCVIRCNPATNPFYLHFALRLPSTQEQFRKWSTGSSYPAILDEDVEKTLVPVPDTEMQDRIALIARTSTALRDAAVAAANAEWSRNMATATIALASDAVAIPGFDGAVAGLVTSVTAILDRLAALGLVEEEQNGEDLQGVLFDDEDEELPG